LIKLKISGNEKRPLEKDNQLGIKESPVDPLPEET